MTGASSAYKFFKVLQVMGDALSGAKGYRRVIGWEIVSSGDASEKR